MVHPVPIVVIDARDAFYPELRGWGRYVRELVGALPDHPGLEYRVISEGGRGPEVLFEQVGLPLRLRRDGADLVHAPNCFLPLVRPCMGVVTIHDLAFEVFPDDFSKRTGWKYRTFARRAARSAQRVTGPTCSRSATCGPRRTSCASSRRSGSCGATDWSIASSSPASTAARASGCASWPAASLCA